MNIDHPYGYPIAFALLTAGLFFLVQTVSALDELREKRIQRRLDRRAKAETRKQFNEITSGFYDRHERP